jgi:hypothetical protein
VNQTDARFQAVGVDLRARHAARESAALAERYRTRECKKSGSMSKAAH